MKEKLLKDIYDVVLDYFGLPPERFIEKTKETDVTDARHFFYYLAKTRNIRGVKIVKFMEELGYDKISSSHVSYGALRAQERAENDDDYYVILQRINNQITI